MAQPLGIKRIVAFAGAAAIVAGSGLFGIPVRASGGGGGAVAPPRPNAADAFNPTKAVRGTIDGFDRAGGKLTVKDDKNRTVSITFDAKTKLRAEDPKEFNGRKNLTPEDLAAATAVRVVYRETDRLAVEVKVLKKKG